ncbi:hypothetical protein GTZ99_14625 [Novosphingobium sp. FSY-8]|uniref:EamA-like transporter family protein n=1 Tax=Novosphingobium ovatum TaxID=1908523 RepID=A0ABW9XHA1_9SPHN|nr:hypothetical protein [Novosphingobium ovatum]NBC37787.1 hypothetical protein [Novosphingobium ovatum]
MLTASMTRTVVMVAFVVVTQVAGGALLGRTQGFQVPVWTAACIAVYTASFYMLARLIQSGVALSLILPVLAALVPLGTILVATTLLGETASWARIGLLVVACGLIGTAATL